MTHHLPLDSYVDTYRYDTPWDNAARRYAFKAFAPFFRKGNALELGCSDGYMTALLSPHFSHIDVVEGAERFIKKASTRALPNVTFHHALFGDYHPKTRYDTIIASYILTHVEDDVGLLAHMKTLLMPAGRICIIVPNRRVLSRQLAQAMGLVSDLATLTDNDRHHGHHHTYDALKLRQRVQAAGLSIVVQGGVLLKPLSDKQMDELIEQGMLGDAHLEGLFRLGMEYPDLCSALYMVCE